MEMVNDENGGRVGGYGESEENFGESDYFLSVL
jgi:hypothetical protein